MPDSSLMSKISPYMMAAESVSNPLFAHLTNVKNRKFTREMYKQQRQDALSDWAMQNEYNSPRAQMQRFQEAGLNPRLIYGQMTDAPSVRSSSSSGGGASAPHVDATRSALAMYDMRQRSAQTDLVAKQMSLMDEEITLKKAQAMATIASSELTGVRKEQALFDLGLSTELRKTTIEGKEVNVEKGRTDIMRMQTEIALLVAKNVRETLLAESTISLQAEQIATLIKGRQKTDADIAKIRQEIELMKKDGTIKELEIKYRQTSNPQDPGVLKVLDGILNRLGFSGGRGSFKTELEELFNPSKRAQSPLPKYVPRRDFRGVDSYGYNQ